MAMRMINVSHFHRLNRKFRLRLATVRVAETIGISGKLL